MALLWLLCGEEMTARVVLTAIERPVSLTGCFSFSILDAEVTRSTSTTTGLAQVFPGSPAIPSGPVDIAKQVHNRRRTCREWSKAWARQR
jgi:hypothetical protein